VKSAFGRIDILVNNAGQSSQRMAGGVSWPVNAVDAVSGNLPPGRFEKITDEEWLKHFNKNFWNGKGDPNGPSSPCECGAGSTSILLD
jgi:NAD(P)-dependent dehydrogenase (short-subunit alcohol dehydrogenase family)